MSISTNQVSTRYSNNMNDSNSVIDLMFLCNSSNELNNHLIYLEWCLILDHTSLIITIPIVEESLNSTKHSIIKDRKEEASFIKDVTIFIRNLNMSNLSDITSLDRVVNDFANIVKSAWEKKLKNHQHHETLQELVGWKL